MLVGDGGNAVLRVADDGLILIDIKLPGDTREWNAAARIDGLYAELSQ